MQQLTERENSVIILMTAGFPPYDYFKKEFFRMKRILAMLMAAMMIAVLGVSVAAADVTGRIVDIEVQKTVVDPVIDGKFDEGSWGEPVSVITKANRDAYLGLCADDKAWLTNDKLLPSDMKSYIRWSDTHLYYCSVIETTSHYNPYKEGQQGELWKGTSFIWQFISDRNNKDTISKVIAALNDEGKLLFNIETGEAKTGVTPGTTDPMWDQFAVVRTGNTTVYEVSFKWSKIMPDGKAPAEKDEVVFYALYMPAIDSTANPVDVAVAGKNDAGKYNYWAVKLGAAPAIETTAAAKAGAAAKPAAAAQTFDPTAIFALVALSAAGAVALKSKKRG